MTLLLVFLWYVVLRRFGGGGKGGTENAIIAGVNEASKIPDMGFILKGV